MVVSFLFSSTIVQLKRLKVNIVSRCKIVLNLFNIYTQMSRGYWVEGGSALPAIRAAFYYQIYITSNIQSIFIHCIRLHGG